MKCEQASELVHGYLDGELDLVGSMEMDRHVAGCQNCSGLLDAQHRLRDAVAAAGIYSFAPPALRSRVRSTLAKSGARTPRVQWFSRSWLAFAASIGLIAVVSWSWTFL